MSENNKKRKTEDSSQDSKSFTGFIGMVTIMFIISEKVENSNQLSKHSVEYIETFKGILDQPYEIQLTCFRCVAVGMSLEEFADMVSGTMSRESVEKKYENLLRSHFTNTEEESRLNSRMDHLIRQAEDTVNHFHTLQEKYADENKKKTDKIVSLLEDRLKDTDEKIDQYKAMAEEYKDRLEKAEQTAEKERGAASKTSSDVRFDDVYEKTGWLHKRKKRNVLRPWNNEVVRFRREYAENEEYSKAQRDYLTMCFGDPDPKKRLSYEEIVMIASPKLSVGQMQTLRDRVIMERGEKT